MDTLTHILTGVAVGQLFSEEYQQPRFRPLIWGAIIANIPDLDVIFQPFISPENSMLFHRGISHSLLLWAVCAPLLALLINRIYKGDRYTYVEWLWIAVIAWGSHILLDIFNTYGTGIFEPFSHERISYDVVNVFDLVYLTIALSLTIVFVFIIKNHFIKNIIALMSLMLPVFYILLITTCKLQVELNAEIQLSKNRIYSTRVISSPLPLSPFAWRVVAETKDGFHIGVFDGFWKERTKFDYIKKNRPMEIDFIYHGDLRKLKQFTQGWYSVDTINGQMFMHDLRFSTLEPGKNALSFPLYIKGNSMKIGRATLNRRITFKNIKEQWKRLKN
ncbi:MAG: metal-dependent hydrolase [Prevotellaceae bacterium]|jgi:inner membrane protein|nr:metal-dependent hydrolase [Prevotellaceae bacterium]